MNFEPTLALMVEVWLLRLGHHHFIVRINHLRNFGSLNSGAIETRLIGVEFIFVESEWGGICVITWLMFCVSNGFLVSEVSAEFLRTWIFPDSSIFPKYDEFPEFQPVHENLSRLDFSSFLPSFISFLFLKLK